MTPTTKIEITTQVPVRRRGTIPRIQGLTRRPCKPQPSFGGRIKRPHGGG